MNRKRENVWPAAPRREESHDCSLVRRRLAADALVPDSEFRLDPTFRQMLFERIAPVNFYDINGRY